MDMKQRMAELDARIAARKAELDRRVGGGATIAQEPVPAEPTRGAKAAPAVVPADEKAFSPAQAVATAAGVQWPLGFSLRKLFREVFRRHSDEEMEDYFSGGYPATTPPPSAVDGSWPAPWVFSRLFLFSVLVYVGFDFGVYHFRNPLLIPGLIVVGSFAVPLSTLVFFLEANVWRDVSLYQIIRLVFLGGVLSLLMSLFLFATPASGLLEASVGASCAGVVEEVGKLVSLVCMVPGRRFGRKLNGLLLGAAVGAGFAAFESAGYAFMLLHGPGGILSCRANLILRGLLAPFGHVAWTAIAGAALWRVKGDSPPRPWMFANGRFLRLFAVPVLLHMLWNASLPVPFLVKYPLLGAVAWIVVFALVQEGLDEARAARGPGRAPARASFPEPSRSGGAFRALFWFVVATFFTGFLLSAGAFFFTRVVAPRLGL